MDISTEKRICDATAKELAELRQELNGQHDSMPEAENKAGDPE